MWRGEQGRRESNPQRLVEERDESVNMQSLVISTHGGHSSRFVENVKVEDSDWAGKAVWKGVKPRIYLFRELDK